MNRKYASFTALICVLATPARALTIPAFRSHPMNEQHLYALGAVNMLAFTRGLEDEGGNPVDRINDWYRTIGEVQLFLALDESPAEFKARFGFYQDDRHLGHDHRFS
jgi:hypothetical protein